LVRVSDLYSGLTLSLKPIDDSKFFDQFYDNIPEDQENRIFVDDVHLFDRGNQMIAREIIKDLKRLEKIEIEKK